MPLTRCIATDPSFSSPIDGRERVRAGEPFSLGLRRDADEALILGEPIGRGAMGVVRVATRKSDGCKFALKTIPKAGPQSLSGQTPTGEAMSIWERKVRDEVSLHFALGASLDIVTLHDGFEDEAGVHLLIDLCDGGDLLSGASAAHSTEDEDNAVRVPETDDEESPGGGPAGDGASCVGECWTPFSEATAAPMIRGMLRALAACHEHGVVHRDVKPANFLFMRENDGRNRLKLSDFGLAARIPAIGATLTEQCGTYAYLSPEMARRRPYDFKVDAWAAGVVAYMLLAGEPPFADWDAIREGRSPTKDGLLRNIRRGKPDTPIENLPLSPGAKSLLQNLLHVDPDKRMSCKEAAEHYWVREKGAASHADALASTVVERLQAYGTLGAVRRASIRAAYQTASSGSFDGSTERLVQAVDEAARAACREHEDECVPDADPKSGGVSSDALMLALRDHGAELNPEEWLSLIRPVTGRRGGGGGTVFVDNAALAAMLATPAGGSFGEHSNSFVADPNHPSIGTAGSDAAMGAAMGAAEGDGFDWDAIAKASFRRILEKSKDRADTVDAFELMDETVTYEDVVDEVCASDGSEELCRVVFEEEFRAADGDGDGRLNVMEWTDLVWAEGLTDQSGRVRSSCGADAPDHHPDTFAKNAGIGGEDCRIAPPSTPPPTELSPRERARAAAAARKKMQEARRKQRGK